MQSTTIQQFSFPVFLTLGMSTADGIQIVGVFESEDDARSSDADDLAIATLGVDQLTPDQLDVAKANSEAAQ